MTYNITLTQADVNKLSAILNLAKASLDDFAISLQNQLVAQSQPPAPESTPPTTEA